MKRIKQYLLILFTICFFNINYCYAQEEYINASIYNDDNSLYFSIYASDNDIYGLLTSFDYNNDILELNTCTSESFDVIIENNILLLESTKGKKNTKIATCEFKILNKQQNVSVGLKDTSLSNSKSVLYNKDVTLSSDVFVENDDDKITNETTKEENIQKNPVTSGGKILIFVIISIVLLFGMIFINKKYKIFNFVILLFLFITPIFVSANNTVTKEIITEIRNILLKKTNSTNAEYDYDNDNKITINDLIISLITLENNNKQDDAGNDDNLEDKPNDGDESNNNSQLATQIKPNGGENIVKNDETETLKVWIEKVDRSGRISFYVTHIWAKEPYKQFKSQVPDNYGSELVTAHNLLKNAVSQNQLENKLAVAVNASGFVLDGVWGQNYYDVNTKYNRTATCPLILSNGKVIRDISNEIMPGSITNVYGLNKNGDLVYYNYPAGNKTEENVAVSQQIKNDGVLNTFTFSPVVVWDGQLKSTSTDQNVRQGLCQIDKNNFVFITDIYSDARTGFSFKELGEYMIGLGCKVGFNLDGGGSTSLIYKEKTGTPAVITSPARQITDIIYFHE